MITATAIPVFNAAGTVLREITPRFYREETPVDPAKCGYSGPIIIFLGPSVEYYIASIVAHTADRLCLDADGRNFGVKGAVYVALADVRQAVEAWRPGFWDACRAQREAAA